MSEKNLKIMYSSSDDKKQKRYEKIEFLGEGQV